MEAAIKPHVVIVGGGFGGLTAAQRLRDARVNVVLIDRTNHHLFQPLLYQVATAALSPGDIASPLRTILHRQRNVRILMNEVLGVDRAKRIVRLREADVRHDERRTCHQPAADLAKRLHALIAWNEMEFTLVQVRSCHFHARVVSPAQQDIVPSIGIHVKHLNALRDHTNAVMDICPSIIAQLIHPKKGFAF